MFWGKPEFGMRYSGFGKKRGNEPSNLRGALAPYPILKNAAYDGRPGGTMIYLIGMKTMIGGMWNYDLFDWLMGYDGWMGKS
jgi:hypothetical protein